MKRFFASVVVLAYVSVAQAYGPWLAQVPIGGVELSDGWSRERLEARFDEIAAANANRPFIATAEAQE